MGRAQVFLGQFLIYFSIVLCDLAKVSLAIYSKIPDSPPALAVLAVALLSVVTLAGFSALNTSLMSLNQTPHTNRDPLPRTVATDNAS